jgi:hypothetical protein
LGKRFHCETFVLHLDDPEKATLTPIDEHQRNSPPLVGVWQGKDLGQLSWIQYLFRKSVSEWIFDIRGDFSGDNAVLVARYAKGRGREYYSQFRGRRVFLIELSDENYDFCAEVYSNFLGVFRTHWSGVFRRERVYPLSLGINNYDFGTPRSFPKSSERDYIWSFLGAINKSSRPEIAKYLGSLEPHFLFATDATDRLSTWNVIDDRVRKLTPERCNHILLDSVFAPSAMGNVNLECWRIYEALEAGAIPILEKRPTLDYFTQMWGKHPLPAVSSWKEAHGFIANMMGSSRQLDDLQSACTNWWAARQEEWTEEIRLFIQRVELAQHPLGVDDFVYPWHRVPGWQIIELLRHHNLPALKRRLLVQARRLLSGKRMRVSSGADKRI